MKNKILAILILGVIWSCSDDEDIYRPDKPATGNVFTVSVGFDKASVDQLGGEEKVRLMMYTNFGSVSRAFNSAGEFNEMHFFVEDFFVFEGKSEGQLNTSHSTDIKFIYNAASIDDDIPDGFYRENNLVVLSNKTVELSNVISQTGIGYFTYAMALSRGAVEYGNGDVLVQNNTIAAEEYVAPRSLMNPFLLGDSWDDLTVALVRASGDGAPVNYLDYIPSTIELLIKEEDTVDEETNEVIEGIAFSGVKITAYPILNRTGLVSEGPVFEGTTDENGKINIAANGNPFEGGANEVYPNLFLEVERDGTKKYTFLPITEVLTSAVVDGNTSFNKVWEVNLKTEEDMRIVHYDFENPDDLDANGDGINAQTNVTHTTDAKVGSGAILFEGAQYFVLDKSESINPSKDYSVSFWFKTTQVNGNNSALWTMSDWSGIMGDDQWKPGGLAIRYNDSSVNYDIGWEGGSSGSVGVSDGLWHQLLTTVDYTSETVATITVFIDGTKVFSNSSNVLYPTWGGHFNGGPGGAAAAVVDNFVLKFGISATNDSEVAAPFSGVIDDIKVFDTALTNDWAFRLFDNTK